MSSHPFAPCVPRRLLGILTALTLVSTSFGQTTISAPYNPDSDADSVIAILDLMSVLGIYGSDFVPSELMVDGNVLQDYIEMLQAAADAAEGDTIYIPSMIPGSLMGQLLVWDGADWGLLNPGSTGEVLKMGTDSLPLWMPAGYDDYIVGCQDPTACNFDPEATVSFEGACEFESCLGCMDSLYVEYNPLALYDDGSCQTLVLAGCTDFTYLEFNPAATTDDGSCETSVVPGCTDPGYYGYNPEANFDDGSCLVEIISGCMDEWAMNYDYTANLDDGSCIHYFYEGCGNVEAVDFEGHSYELITIAGRCWFAENLRTAHYSNGDSILSGTEEDWASGQQGLQTVYGQMDIDCNNICDPASNLSNYGRLYNAYAVQDGRGLCPTGFEVASDSAWMEVESHLGMTEEELYLTEQWRNPEVALKLMSSPSDEVPWNGTNASGMTLTPAGVFAASDQVYYDEGSYCYFWSPGEEETSGFSWRRAIQSGYSGVNRAERSSRNGSSVRCVQITPETSCYDPDFDGVCASDEVGGCTDSEADNYDSAATEDDGSCTYPVFDCSAENTLTYQGHAYALVEIDGQCWFAENLRSVVYANGDSLLAHLSDSDWGNATQGALTVYGEGNSSVLNGSDDEEANLAAYGRLYNWFAVDDGRGLCPNGWHVPSDEEWIRLEVELGMSSSEANNYGWRGTDQGAQMKSSPSDNPSWDGTNSSGFSALPGGRRLISGFFDDEGDAGYWWSSTLDGNYGRSRELNSDEVEVSRQNNNRRVGQSVRCVGDIPGCMDPDYFEYIPEANTDDGSCATLIVPGCTDPAADNFNPEANIENETCSFACGGLDAVSFDGHDYTLVAIGTQCWFAENLRTTVYANGDSIAGDLSGTEWVSTSAGAHTVYGEGSTSVIDGSDDEVANLEAYGRLYNWYAVDDSRGLCPSGWHIPSDEEWITLEMELGMSSSDANSTGWRGTDEGVQMKSSPSDSPSWNGSNTSGFSALPGGYRNSDSGNFELEGTAGVWWSASLNGAYAWSRNLGSYGDNVNRNSNVIRAGLSVRCVLGVEEVYGCMDSEADNFNPSANIDNGTCSFACGGLDAVSFDGHDYTLVAIGTQCWFAENLRTTVYANGDSIAGDLSATEWVSTSAGAHTVYGEGSTSVIDGSDDEVANLEAYGRLYNWYAVDDSRGLCPSGWHIPSDGEWITLEMELGMSSSDANSTGWRGTDEGAQMKSSPLDSPSWNGSNGSGFSALPGGYRNSGSGNFELEGIAGVWWSATLNGVSNAWYRNIGSNGDNVNRNATALRSGFSIRCVLGVEEIYGCTNPSSCNFDAYATVDDGSCGVSSVVWSLTTDAYPGETTWQITDSTGLVLASDGPYSLSETTTIDTLCLPDGCFTLTVFDSYGDGMQYQGIVGDYVLTDGNGVVLAEMIAGGNFGSEAIHEFCLTSSVVVGCTDSEATNYNPSATSNDGSCDYSTSGCTPVTFDGHTYEVVAIGSQCWFAENLRTTVYADGSTIPANLGDSQWTSTNSGATTIYGEDSFSCDGDCDEVANLAAYGRLYNWYAVDDSRGLCPSGWHVPTDAEWMTLEMELGMSSSEVEVYSWRGTDQGAQMKSSPLDIPSWNGTNSSGFSAMPGGWRNGYIGNFDNEGSNGFWWSASPDIASYAWYRALSSEFDGVYRFSSIQRLGFSVRCLRDE